MNQRKMSMSFVKYVVGVATALSLVACGGGSAGHRLVEQRRR
jgi:hypothetical protein